MSFLNQIGGTFSTATLYRGMINFKLANGTSFLQSTTDTDLGWVGGTEAFGWVGTATTVPGAGVFGGLEWWESWKQNPTDLTYYNDDRANTYQFWQSEVALPVAHNNWKYVFYLAGGDDVLKTGYGKDHVYGGNGKDTISTGTGNDRLAGGAGNDILTGGAGDDIFVFDTSVNATSNVDKITDFGNGDDTFWLDDAVFSSLSPKGVLSSQQFSANAAGMAQDASDRIIYETDTGALFYDADGNGSVAAVRFASIAPALNLTNSDFFVI